MPDIILIVFIQLYFTPEDLKKKIIGLSSQVFIRDAAGISEKDENRSKSTKVTKVTIIISTTEPTVTTVPEYRLHQLRHLVLRLVPHGGAPVDGRHDDLVVHVRLDVDVDRVLWIDLLPYLLALRVLEDEVDDAAVVVLHLGVAATTVEQEGLFEENVRVERCHEQPVAYYTNGGLPITAISAY